MITVDAHIDLPWIHSKFGPFDLTTQAGPTDHNATDFPRMKKGKLDAFFAALYLPDSWQDRMTKKEIRNLLAEQYRWLYRTPGVNIVNNLTAGADGWASMIQECIDGESIPVLLGLEGGRLIGEDLDYLTTLATLGVKYLTLTHNRNNSWADSATDYPTDEALTKFGIEVLKKCHELGIWVDVSHSHDNTIAAVLEHAPGIVLATHSGVRSLTEHGRNLPDWYIDKMDFIGVPFAKRFIGEYQVAEHIDYICQRHGTHTKVGIGSDLDGAVLVKACPDVSKWSFWMEDLWEMNYTRDQIADIAGGNWMRLLK